MREHVKYTRIELRDYSLDELYKRLIAHHINGDELKVYREHVKLAKEMALGGRLPEDADNFEIRSSGIHAVSGKGVSGNMRIF